MTCLDLRKRRNIKADLADVQRMSLPVRMHGLACGRMGSSHP